MIHGDWRIDWDWWVRSPQYSTHYEVTSSGNYYCSLYKWWWTDTQAWSYNVTESLDYENPYFKWTFGWHEYRVYRQSWSNWYYCSAWLRKFWLQMYTTWVQSILQNTSWTPWNPWPRWMCTHGQCWDSYSYLSSKTNTDSHPNSTASHWADWNCYWYTLWN